MKAPIENDDYIALLRRLLARLPARMRDGDREDLVGLLELREQLSEILHQVVWLLRANGATWQEIGDLTGVSRQAAHQMWGNPTRFGKGTTEQ